MPSSNKLLSFVGWALIAPAFFLLTPSLDAATLTVTTTDDIIAIDGECSLREAVTAANTNMPFSDCPAGEPMATIDVIELPAGTYTLTLEPIGDDANLGGDLDILEPVTVRGLGDDFIWWDDDTTPEIETLDVFNNPDGFPRTFAEADLPDVVIEMGLGEPSSLGDGDRIFHILDPVRGVSSRGQVAPPEVTFENLGIVRGEAFCEDMDLCSPGGGGIEHRSAAHLTLRRVALFENSAGCGDFRCGLVPSAAAIYMVSEKNLRILDSVIASTRAFCSDSDCGADSIVYHEAFGASEDTLFELDQSLVTDNSVTCTAAGCRANHMILTPAKALRIHQSVLTGNTLSCEAAGLQCNVRGLLFFTEPGGGLACDDAGCLRDMQDVEISATTLRCDGLDCNTSNILDAGESLEQTYARIRFRDNDQQCTGFSCNLNPIAELRESDESGASLTLSEIEILDNVNVCEGTDCEADHALHLRGQGLATVANLTVRGESRCLGAECSPSDLVLLDQVASVDGLSITESEVSCTGDECFARPILSIITAGPAPLGVTDLVVTGNLATCSGVNCGFGTTFDPAFIGFGGIVSLLSLGESITLDRATISDNVTSTRGTLASNANLTIIDSSFTGNIAADGGAIINGWQSASSPLLPGELTLENTTLDGNTAGSLLRGIGTQGGGIFNPAGSTLRLRGSAITNNVASSGGGIWNAGTIVQRQNTVIEGNTPDDCFDAGGTGCGVLFSDGFESGGTTHWSVTSP